MDEKVKIRSKLIKIRKSFSEEERAFKSGNIRSRLEDMKAFKEARHILFYYSCNGEADTRGLIEEYLDKKNIYLPVIRGKSHFQAIPVSRPLDLKKGFEGVPEPAGAEPNSVFDGHIELVVTPGVAFDKKGNRIGMGKGYYDRYFELNKKPVRIALAFEEQVLDYVPKDTYDESVDFIVTDKNTYRCDPR